MNVDDEMLMAAVDGELDAAQTAEIMALAQSDPAIAARLARFQRSRDAVAAAFAPLREAPVPGRLVAAARGESARPSRSFAVTPRWAMPIAAGLVGVGVALGLLLPALIAPVGPESPAFLASVASVAWGPELGDTPTGGELSVPTDGRVLVARVTATYPTEEGDCRTFSVTEGQGRVDGMACVGGFGWQTVALLPAGADGYATASAAATGAIDALLDSLGAEAPRTAEDEAARIADGWR